jgi:FkbM family methyltransferase
MLSVLLRFLLKPWYLIFQAGTLSELRIRSLERSYPRDTPGRLVLSGVEFFFHDAPTFANQYREIFNKEIYYIETNKRNPLIIDCGANMGLALKYWKGIFPEARMIAIEPDENIFQTLKKNVETFSSQVRLLQGLLWTQEGRISFQADGRQGGRAGYGNQEVETYRLSNILKEFEQVDLLKIDIEGAEFSVVSEAESELWRVKRVFMEFHHFEGQTSRLRELLDLIVRSGFDIIISGESWNKPFTEPFPDSGLRFTLNVYASRV